jgi:hypothetical protein
MRKELHKLVVEAIKASRVVFSDHAFLGMEECNLTLESTMDLAVRASIVEVEENFSYKRYIYPTCIIDSTTKNGAVVRSVWAYNKETKWVKLCSVYFRTQWFRYRVRG